MKKTYVVPRMECEEFTPNEYVAACVQGTIQCVYPGDGKTNGDTGRYDDYNGKASGIYKDSMGMWHGLCGYDAPISFSSETGSGYETNNGTIQKSRPISNITGYSLSSGTYYNVTWKSTDGNGNYSHKGRLIITNIDNNHPNRS